MQSSIGKYFGTKNTQRFAFGLGVAAVTIDFICVVLRFGDDVRLAFALSEFALLLYLTDGNLNSIGLQLSPRQGWKPWGRVSVVIGIIVFSCIVLGLGICLLFGCDIPKPMISPSSFLLSFIYMCFVAPILEETVYRLVVCVSLVSFLGCWKTIALNGFLFAILHVLYGNPSPENLIGGFFLAWAYLKSETILIPVLLHSIGNSFALISQMVTWYIFN